MERRARNANTYNLTTFLVGFCCAAWSCVATAQSLSDDVTALSGSASVFTDVTHTRTDRGFHRHQYRARFRCVWASGWNIGEVRTLWNYSMAAPYEPAETAQMVSRAAIAPLPAPLATHILIPAAVWILTWATQLAPSATIRGL